MLSNKTLEKYMFEIRHEANKAKKTAEFPNKLLFEWIHKDICETVLSFGPQLDQIYRTSATLSIQDCAGKLVSAAVNHSSGVVAVTGFTGLSVNAWGSILVVNSDKFYAGLIKENDATTLTLNDGSSLPVLSSATVILTSNNNKYSIDISSLLMIQYSEPIWQVLDSNSEKINVISIVEAANIKTDIMNQNNAFYYLDKEIIQLVTGASKTLSGDVTVGYYKLPTEATALTALIDLPVEYHSFAQRKTLIRILRKAGRLGEAQALEAETEKEES